jgi:UDP-glucose 4-epimerase
LVTGVSGAVGARVAERLLRHPMCGGVLGVDVVSPPVVDPRLDVRLIDLADPRDAQTGRSLDEAVDGVGAVLHLAWSVADSRGAEDAVARANHRALQAVLGAAAKTGARSFVYLSSATVYGAWPDNKIPLTEDARLRPNPGFSFAVAKAEGERMVSEWAAGHPDVAVAVLRPCVAVGAGDKPLYDALGVVRVPGSGDPSRPVQYIHVDDLADAVVLVWEKRLAGVYNVAPDTGIPEEHARALAGGVARVHLPERLSAAVSAAGWRLWRRGVPAEARLYATHPWVVAPDRLVAEGWSPRFSSEEALVATDRRLHWDDLPPGTRQNLNLVVAAAAVALLSGGMFEVLRRFRRRRRRPALL